jgi:HAD superfamily hydrolase (TIGR01549 family)
VHLSGDRTCIDDPMLSAVLFDLDDTLFDHSRSARAALESVRHRHPAFLDWPIDAFERSHGHWLESFHARVVAGEMSVDEARLDRFRALYREVSVEPSEAELAETAAAYRAAYMTARAPVDGALALLTALRPHVRLGIVSNNVVREQMDKIRHLGFDRFFDAIVISEAAGVAKPDSGIFAVALDRLGCAAGAAVMIGDSWSKDVEGALAAGIRPIYFNRSGQPAPDACAVVTALNPIDPVLTAIFGDARPSALQCA